MSRLLLLLAVVTTSTLAAADPKPAKPATDHEVCVAAFQKQRSCTDQFIPALVDLRAKHDKPAGIAAKVKADRAGVIAEAKKEWANDSKDAAIDQNCTKMEADKSSHAMVAPVQACLAKTACDAFVTCILPVIEKHIDK